MALEEEEDEEEEETASDQGNGYIHTLFQEAPDYYTASPQPTTQNYTLLTGHSIHLRLVGHNPLWGHHLWNGGRMIASYLEQRPHLVSGKTVLELGAAAGLPSLVCGILGAKKVVITDFPDPDLVSNILINIENCDLLPKAQGSEPRVVAEGFCWGADPQPLLSKLPAGEAGFDVLILADLLFNHSEHEKLVKTITATLFKDANSIALVFFSPYRPWLYEKDMAFFPLVEAAGFRVEKLFVKKMGKVMFEDDPGDEELRKTVFGYAVRWAL